VSLTGVVSCEQKNIESAKPASTMQDLASRKPLVAITIIPTRNSQLTTHNSPLRPLGFLQMVEQLPGTVPARVLFESTLASTMRESL
jgi:hypothetical protein